jgi:RNA polymerase sigma-70 factor (ECF subfamily)
MSAKPHTAPQAIFATTRWTMVSDAGGEPSPRAAEALESLCEAYWFPLYAYVRRCGQSKQDAEDLTQGFFLHLLGRSDLSGLDREKGKFRSFLLASLKNFIANEVDRKRTAKRGGNIDHFPLDWSDADAKYQLVCSSTLPPDAAYDREWATILLKRVLQNLKEEFSAAGKQEEFAKIKKFLTIGRGEIPYDEAAVEMNITSTALRVAVHRLRKRYRELLKKEVGKTVAEGETVNDELSELLAAFRYDA